MKRKKRVDTKKRPTKTPIIVKASLIIIVFFVLFATVFKITELILTHKTDNFPKLEISLANVPLEQIDMESKDIEYPGNTTTITINDHSTVYEDVEIKGRGNSTWAKAKKPYQLKFKEKTSLFNSTPTKKWVLLANSFDNTYLKNDLTFKIANILSDAFVPNGNFIELTVDDSYRGLYYLTKKIDIGASYVDLDDPLGVLVELDNLYKDEEECHYDRTGNCLVIKSLVNKDQKDASIQDFLANFNALERAIRLRNFSKIKDLIDIDSFAKYYLLNEFTINPDAYSTSFFLHKNGPSDVIHAGPIWDFDLAFNSSPDKAKDSRKEYNEHNSSCNIVLDLMDIPEFETRVKEIYQETLSGHGEELLDYIKSQAEYIRPAVLRDQERWKLKTNFDEEIDHLIDWVAKRYDHFEQTYGLEPVETNSDPALESPQPSQEL